MQQPVHATAAMPEVIRLTYYWCRSGGMAYGALEEDGIEAMAWYMVS